MARRTSTSWVGIFVPFYLVHTYLILHGDEEEKKLSPILTPCMTNIRISAL
jgi:hypothetical protein